MCIRRWSLWIFCFKSRSSFCGLYSLFTSWTILDNLLIWNLCSQSHALSCQLGPLLLLGVVTWAVLKPRGARACLLYLQGHCRPIYFCTFQTHDGNDFPLQFKLQCSLPLYLWSCDKNISHCIVQLDATTKPLIVSMCTPFSSWNWQGPIAINLQKPVGAIDYTLNCATSFHPHLRRLKNPQYGLRWP